MDGYECGMDGDDKFMWKICLLISLGSWVAAVFIVVFLLCQHKWPPDKVSTASNDRQEFDGRWMPLVFLRPGQPQSDARRRQKKPLVFRATEKSLAVKTSRCWKDRYVIPFVYWDYYCSIWLLLVFLPLCLRHYCEKLLSYIIIITKFLAIVIVIIVRR